MFASIQIPKHSDLRSSTARKWEHASTFAGVNRELWPLAGMTFLPALGRLTELVISAAPENPGNADLKAVAASLRFAEMAAEENERIVMQLVPFENIAQWPRLLDGPLKKVLPPCPDR